MSLECRPVDQRADDRLHEHLLTFLRDTLRIPELAYAEPPVRLSGGYFTTVYALRLAGAAPPWSEPLILRVMPDHSEALLLRRERAVQNVVADLGFPAPRVLASSDGRETLGHAFLLMERMPGRALLGGVELRWILTRGVRLLQTLPRITAETQARLHALDPEPLRRAMEAEGIPPQCAGVERWLNEIAATVERWSLDGLLPGLHWLIDRRPRELQRLGPQALSERRGSKRGEQLGHGSNMGCPGRERNHQRNWMVEARPSRPMLTLWTPDAMRVLRSATLLTGWPLTAVTISPGRRKRPA